MHACTSFVFQELRVYRRNRGFGSGNRGEFAESEGIPDRENRLWPVCFSGVHVGVCEGGIGAEVPVDTGEVFGVGCGCGLCETRARGCR